MQLLKFRLGCSIVLFGLLFPVAGVWAGQDHLSHQNAHIKASGVVTKVTKTGITLKTPSASVTLNVNATERSGLTHVKVGDELVTRVILKNDRAMEFVHLKDLRGSGTEPLNVLSGYRWQDGFGYYEVTRDTASHFFIDRLPPGTHVF